MNLLRVLAGAAVLPLALAAQPSRCTGPPDLEQAARQTPSAAVQNALGAWFAQRRNHPCAIAAFERAVQLAPDSWESQFNLALALFEGGDAARAVPGFLKALALNPDLEPARRALIVASLDSGDPRQAEEHGRALLTRNERDVFALHHLGLALIAQRRHAAAIPYFERAIAAEPAEIGHRLALAQALEGSGQPDKALELLKQMAGHPNAPALVHFNLATLYARQKRFAEAAGEYRIALELDAGNNVARISLVKALIGLDRHADALPVLDEVARREPLERELPYLRGLALRGLGRYDEAATELETAVARDPSSYDARYNYGFVLNRLGRLEEARTQLEQALRLNPESGDARFQLATVLRGLKETDRAKQELQTFEQIRQRGREENLASTVASRANRLLVEGKPREAAAAYREALAIDAGNAKTWYNLALALAAGGDRAGEREALEKSVALDGQFVPARVQLGLLLLNAGEDRQAEQAFRRALEIDPQFAEAYSNLGVLHGRRGQPAEAERLFRQAIETDPRFTQAYVNLGLILAEQGRFIDAEKELRKAVDLDAGNTRALTALGMVLGRTGNKAAVETFEKVAALEPASAEAHLNLGIALADAFQPERALAAFAKAAELAPGLAAAHYNQGRALIDLKRYQEALPALETAHRLEPGFAHTLYLLAQAQRQLNRPAESRQWLEKLLALEPAHPDGLFLLGQNLRSLGQTAGAIDAWKRALAAKPDHAEALYQLQRALVSSDPAAAKQYGERYQAIRSQGETTDRAQTLANFGIGAAASGDYPRAIAQLREAIDVCGECPSLGELRKNLGLIYSRAGQLEEGKRELELARGLLPGDPEIARALDVIRELNAKRGENSR